MAKVVYQNKSDNILTCIHCKSVVEYDKSDIQHWTDSNGPGGCGDYYEYVDCPSCNRSIDVN